MSRTGNLLKLISAQFISAIGDQLYMVAILFLVLSVERHLPSLKAGLVNFFETLPYLTIGLFAGALVDRFSRKKLLIVSDLARALILLSVPLLWRMNLINWITLSLIGFSLSSFNTIFAPARDIFVTYLVDRRELGKANSYIQTSYQFAIFLGGMLAPIILSIKNDLIFLLFLDSFTFLISALLIWSIRIREPSIPARREGVIREILEGLKYVKENRLFLYLLILTALDNLFIMGPAVVGANLYIKEFLGLTAREYAWFQAFMSLGWFLSALILSRIYNRLNDFSVLKWGVFLDGFTYFPFVFISHFPTALFFIFIHGLSIPLITVSRTTIVQKYADEKFRGRIFALINLAVVGFMSLSSLITGILGEIVPANYLFLWASVGGSLSGILAFILFKDYR